MKKAEVKHMKRYVRSWYTGEPDPGGMMEGKARFLMRINNWRDAYDHFTKIVDKYFPDSDKIEVEVDRLYNQYKGNKYFDEAYKRWKEDQESEDFPMYPYDDEIE